MSNLAKARAALKKNNKVDFKNRVELDPENMQAIPAISTGSLVIDYLIGGNKLSNGQRQCPGIPRGRMTEIYGPEGSGKCLTEDTYLQTEYGMLTVGELFEKCGKSATISTKVEPHTVRLLNERGEMEATSHLTWNGRRKVYHVGTDRGFSLSMTANHPVRVLDETGYIIWKKAGDLQKDDVLVSMTQGHFPSASSISGDEARLLGYLVADGSMSGANRIGFSNSVEDVVQDYNALIASVMGSDTNILSYPKAASKTVDHHINDKEGVASFRDKYGMEAVVAVEKTVPLCVREGDRTAQEEFLRSYVECECSIDVRKRAIEVTSASFTLAQQVQLMLLSMGYVASLKPKAVAEYPENDYWRVTWCGEHAVRYGEEIGFVSAERKAAFAEFSQMPFNSNVDGVPNLSGMLQSLYKSLGDTSRADNRLFEDYMTGKANPSKDRLRRILKACKGRGDATSQMIQSYLNTLLERDYIFSSVCSIETEDGVPTFDVCLPETHSFWSNGLISHNTTLALETAVKCQNEGGSVVFLDYENAIAPAYAQALGVDFDEDKWDLYSPTTWEEGAEIIKIMVNAGVDLIIVDSVSAMVPQATFEKDPSETGQIGLLARLQSMFLPNIVHNLRSSGTSLVYLNQMRSRIKTSRYDTGPDEDTSGGRALKYYASLRLKLKKTRTEYSQVENDLTGDSEKQPICNIVRAQCTKNKCSMHQGHSTDFVLRYGEGIDNVRSIMDIAENRRILNRAGAWYKFVDSSGEEVSLQGKEAVRDYLFENQSQFAHMVEQVSSFSSIGGPGAAPASAGEEGVDTSGDPEVEVLIDRAVEDGIIDQAGPWYKFTDEDGEAQSFRGKDAAIAYLSDNPATAVFLEGELDE